MSQVSYMFDILKAGKAYVTKDFSDMKETLNQEDYGTFFIKKNGKKYGYTVNENMPLKKLYGFPFFVVDFFFSDIDTLNNKEEEPLLEEVFSHMSNYLKENKGYYNVRVPSHIVGVVKMFNQFVKNTMLCGGIVTYIGGTESVRETNFGKANCFIADKEYIEKHENQLMDIAKSSFSNYQGQYHTSHVTADLAGSIYVNWLENAFQLDSNLDTYIVEHQENIAGFHTVEKRNDFTIGVLGGIDPTFRGIGAYKSMIEKMTTDAVKSGKHLVIGTQLDNFTVQGVWGQYGLKPFHTFYNFHLDNR